jgi:predicted Zn-dependent peptidase
MLAGLDGAFNLSETYQGLHAYGQNIDHLHQQIAEFRTITPKQLQDLAKEHLNINEFRTVVVGQ